MKYKIKDKLKYCGNMFDNFVYGDLYQIDLIYEDSIYSIRIKDKNGLSTPLTESEVDRNFIKIYPSCTRQFTTNSINLNIIDDALDEQIQSANWDTKQYKEHDYEELSDAWYKGPIDFRGKK